MTQLAEEAVEWLMRLGEDDSTACRRDFYAWFNRSPRHVEEFLEATETARSLRLLDQERRIDIEALIREASSNVVPLSGDAVPESRTRSRRTPRVAAAAAALVLAAVTYFALRDQHSQVVTNIGEQRTLKLTDGSTLTLNTRSRAQILFDSHSRDVRLIDGEALFSVARDAERPFRVLTNDATIQALGTQFDVRRNAQGTSVSVIEGTVRVASVERTDATSVAQVSEGEQALVSAALGVKTHALANPASTLAWRDRRLEFHDVALTDVAAEFNRYNALQIRVEGELDTSKRITGIFNADNPEAFIRFLRQDPSLELKRTDQELVIRMAGR